MNSIVCGNGKCRQKFYFDEEDVKTRDFGAYPGVPPIEGTEKYIVCPLCGKEIFINLPQQKTT